MPDPIEQKAEEELRHWLNHTIEATIPGAFFAGYCAAGEEQRHGHLNCEEMDDTHRLWQEELAEAEAERDEALGSLRWIAEWCESHIAVQKEDARLGTGATLENRFRWACIVIEKMGENARRASEP